jgi:hypothetical protein
MIVYLVVIVYKDRSVLVESVYADFDRAQNRCDNLQDGYRNLQNNNVDFTYVTQGYNVIQ